MSLRRIQMIVAAVILVAWMAGCRDAMVDDGKLRPLDASGFFEDGALARPLVEGTVARGNLNEDEAFFTGKVEGKLVAELPLSVNVGLLARGRERFDIFCSVCHGLNGNGNGMIVQRGFPNPPTFHLERLREAPDGHFFDVITNGYGVMYPYGSRVEPEDRWSIVAYIRALQLSRAVSWDDLLPEEQQKLERMSH